MNNRSKTEILPIGTHSCAEIGAFHHYVKHHLKPIRQLADTNNFALSEPMIFGLGCGLAFNFEQNSKGVIHLSTVNDQHIKDLLAHLNIKAWYKTEPNSHKFINYLGDLLLQSGPLVTFNKKANNLFYQYYPVLVLGCNSTKTSFEVYDFFSNEQKNIDAEALIKACDFSGLNSSLHNFWFDIALPEKIFPFEKSVKWALVKNIQSMLYSPGNTKGLDALSSFSSFLGNIQNAYSGKSFRSNITHIKSALKGNKHSSIANRGLFIDFLILALEILKINEISSVAEAFNNSLMKWDYLYNILEMIEASEAQDITKLLEKASSHCIEIVAIEEKALNKLEKILLGKILHLNE